MTDTSSGVSLGRVTTVLLLGRAVGYGLALVNSVIIARTLGAQLLGEYAYAMGLAALFGLIPHMGVATIVTRTIAVDPDKAAMVVRTALRAQTILAVCVLLVIPIFAAALPTQPVPLIYVAIAATQLAIGALSWPYLAVLGGRARYDRLAAAELIGGFVMTVSLVSVAAIRGDVAAFLSVQVLSAVCSVLAARWAAKPFIQGTSTDRFPLRTLFRQAAPFGATAAVGSLHTRLDTLLLGQMASTTALGLYNVAYKPVTMAISLGGTIAGTLFPVMAQPPQIGIPTSFDRGVRALGVTAPAMALAFCGLAEPLLRLLYGEEFTAAAPILLLLAWAAAAHWLYAPLGIALQARGFERGWLTALAFGAIVNAAGNLWAIPRWGAVGAAGVTLVSQLVVLAFGLVLALHKLEFPLPHRSILIGLGATAIGWAVLNLLAPRGAVAATGAALCAYGAVLFVFRVLSKDDVVMAGGWFRQAVSGWSRH
ncbi:MAG: oligosaccharide flippase family protein [Acidobacteriota bacterium]